MKTGDKYLVYKSVFNHDIPPWITFRITQVKLGVWWCSVDMIVFRLFDHITLATANMFWRNLYRMFPIYYLVKITESGRKDNSYSSNFNECK